MHIFGERLSNINGVFNVIDYGADSTGTYDSTNAIQKACNDAWAVGGTVTFPAGKFLCNIVVANGQTGITLRGAGSTTAYTSKMNGGTILYPFNKAKPVVTFGDAVNQTSGVVMENLSIAGDFATAGSHGLVINGVHHMRVDNVSIADMGGDGLQILCGPSSVSATEYVYFNNFEIIGCNGNGIYQRGTSGGWISAVYFTNFALIQGSTLPNTYLVNTDGDVNFTNGWIQPVPRDGNGNYYGCIYLGGSGSANAHFYAQNVNIDEIDSTAVIFILGNVTSTQNTYYQSSYLIGTFTSVGVVQYSDGVTVNINTASTTSPYIEDIMYFRIPGNAATASSGTQPALTGYSYNGTNFLRVANTGLALELTYQNPITHSYHQGSFWQNATTGHLRWDPAHRVPTGDSSGGGLTWTAANKVNFLHVNTGQQVVASYSPNLSYYASIGLQNYMITTHFNVITADTAITAVVQYTDRAGNVVTAPIYTNSGVSLGTATARSVGDTHCQPLMIVADPTQPIQVLVTAGTSNQLYSSASIVMLH